MNKFSVKLFIIATSLALFLSVCTAAAAVNFPTRNIDLVVPFAAGGAVDISSRILAVELANILGQPVSVVNRPGGGATIGQTSVVNADPDGYTLLTVTSSFVTNALGDAATFGIDDLKPVAMFTFDPQFVVASAHSGIETMEQFMKIGRSDL